jgi:F0F1-type ATP synthase assembly protein I
MKSDSSRQQQSVKNLSDSFKKAGPYINISYVLIASIAMLGALGWWIDQRSGTEPLFIITGIFAGFFLGMYNLFQVLKKLEKKG